jgi:hypothetical protein
MPTAILAAALAAQLLPAPGTARWEPLIEDPMGVTSIDPASLARDGDVVRFITRTDRLARAGDDDAGGMNMLVARVAIDCRRRLIGMAERDIYDDGGRFVQSIPAEAGGIAFQPLADIPVPDRVLERVCAPAGRR